MKRFLKYAITIIVVMILVPMTANAQTIKRSKQKTEQTTKKATKKSDERTTKSAKASKDKANKSSFSNWKDQKSKQKNSQADSTIKAKPKKGGIVLTKDKSDDEQNNKRKDGGQQGLTSGNSNQGMLAGKPGISGLVGYTFDYWAKPVPNSKWSGSVMVRVTVDPRGKVTSAKATGATGDLAPHPEVRRACEQAALKSSFSVPKNTKTEGIGTLTYIWY